MKNEKVTKLMLLYKLAIIQLIIIATKLLYH